MTDGKNKGFVKTYRCALDHPLFAAQPETLSVWIHLISDASWKPTRRMVKGQMVSLERGQLVASQRFLSQRTGVSRQRIRTILSKLVSERAIKISNPVSNPASAIITICNYERYQDQDVSAQPSDKPVINPTPTQEQPSINPNTRKVRTKEGKEEEYTCVFEKFWKAFPRERRVAKPKSFEKFKSVVSSGAATADDLVEAVRCGNGIDPDYPPQPMRWLNESRWNDEPQGKKAIAAKKRKSVQDRPEPAWMTIQRENGRRHARAMGVPEHEII